MNEERKSFEQLVSEKAGCLEFAWNGYIRIYEEGEKYCECKDCIAMNKLKNDFDNIYTRIPIDMPFKNLVDKEIKSVENAKN